MEWFISDQAEKSYICDGKNDELYELCRIIWKW